MLISILLLAMAGEPAAAGPKTDKPKLVCARETPTGSRFSKTVCRSPEEARRRTEEHRRAMEETINRPVVSTAKGS